MMVPLMSYQTLQWMGCPRSDWMGLSMDYLMAMSMEESMEYMKVYLK